MIFEEIPPLDNDAQVWTKWFAWHPVRIQTYPYGIIAWLEVVERMQQEHYHEKFYIYRVIK